MPQTLTAEKTAAENKNTTAEILVKTGRKKADFEKIYFFLSPFITVLILHILQLPYHHITKETFVFFTAKVLLSCVFFGSALFFFASLFSNRLIGFYVSNFVFVFLAAASSVMMSITNSPLLPIDFVMASQLGKISGFVKLPIKPYLSLGITLFALHAIIYTSAFLYLRRKKKFNIKRYFRSLVLASVFFGTMFHLVCYDKYFKYTILPKIDCKISGFDSANNYFSNGFILTFFPRIGELTVEKPDGYSKETLANLADTYAVMDVNAAKDKTKVNVIAIQCESWWDPTKLENVTMSEDPMKNIRALGEKYYFGDMVSPSFGCNTCIPEFEYLTFLSTNLLPEGGYPYSQYVRKPIYSLARIFKDNGYNALAIHTYDKNFYNRSKAYPLMGFDRLLGYTDLENPVKKGTYISDMYLSEQIIEKYEQSIDKPLFLYAVSMQNHGNYLVPRYGSYDVEVNSDALSAEDLSGLREAVQGIYDIDKAFMHLVDYFKKQKEPVLIVMYGDHLPFLGINSSTFKSLGFMKGDSTEQNPNMYETPYIVWANFDISQFDLKKRVGPQYLGVNTVKMANLKNVPWHFSFFDEFYTKHTVYQHTNVCDENGDYAPYESITDEEIANYKILQYNCLFGKENFVSDKSEK